MKTKVEFDSRQSMTDHDMLIRLDTKVDSVIDNFKSLQDGMQARLLTVESKIRDIDAVHAQVDPLGSKKQIQEDAEWIHDFKLRWKFIVFLIGFLGGVASVILTIISFITHILPLGIIIH